MVENDQKKEKRDGVLSKVTRSIQEEALASEIAPRGNWRVGTEKH